MTPPLAVNITEPLPQIIELDGLVELPIVGTAFTITVTLEEQLCLQASVTVTV